MYRLLIRSKELKRKNKNTYLFFISILYCLIINLYNIGKKVNMKINIVKSIGNFSVIPLITPINKKIEKPISGNLKIKNTNINEDITINILLKGNDVDKRIEIRKKSIKTGIYEYFNNLLLLRDKSINLFFYVYFNNKK